MPLQPSGVPARAAIQAAIDEAVAAISVDTGWVSMTTSVSGAVAQYRVVGKFVTVVISGTWSLATGTNVTLVSAINGVPAQYRSGLAVGIWGTMYHSGSIGGVGMNPDGSIIVRQNSGGTASGSAGGTITFMAA